MTVAKGPDKAIVLNGDDLRKAFEAATRCLERQRDAINALNVFPVPDGDTGTNMLLTMRSVNAESLQAPTSSAGEVMAAMARGALLGARGNSGVILSQFFHGLAQGLHGKDEFNGGDLTQAFELASGAAYSSVSVPVDGTMLTVIRELSLAASRSVGSRGGYGDVLSVWWAALEASKEALSRTPLQLSVLGEAGVVDAGGQGVVTLLEGAWYCLAGEDVDELELELCAPLLPDKSSGDVSLVRDSGQPRVREEYLAATEDELYGYCTQFLMQGKELDVEVLREELSALAQSTVVAGNEDLVKVHVHAHDPGPVISYAVSLGTISQVSMDNMDRQHREFVALQRGQPKSAFSEVLVNSSMAVVAVAWGEGFARLFEGLGCSAVVIGGQTMNPSTQELLSAARNTGAEQVVLLPNNPNIIPAARQAASVAAGDSSVEMVLHVIPSRTIPQGVAALLAFNPEGPLDANLASMEEALATVKTVEVTKAVRPVTLGGLSVQEGQYIGLLEGDLVVAGDTAFSTLHLALQQAISPQHEVLTLYWGGDIQEDQARDAATQLREHIPGVDIEVVHGGQPFYQYIASLE